MLMVIADKKRKLLWVGETELRAEYEKRRKKELYREPEIGMCAHMYRINLMEKRWTSF
ncbi:MAG: hypothetical protein FWE78_03655 [Methanimicrococcus sp.]|nr:hypothetical protein [Methanimicrococcus sp.]